jgi:hypothetical protein
LKVGVVCAVLALIVVPSGGATAGSFWTVVKVLRKLDRTSIPVARRSIRVRSETTLCAGEGPSIRVRRVRMWRRFVCTYTTYTRRGDRDLDFRVHTRTATVFTVSDAHWVGPTR